MSAIHDRLETIFQQVFNDDDLTLTDAMTSEDVEGWESVTHINLMFAIESEFGIQFPGNELAEFENIGALKRYLVERC
jgi:acyl carrier protein